MSMSKLSKQDQEMIQEQGERLFMLTPLLFRDVVNVALKKENEKLKQEKEELLELIRKKDSEIKKSMKTMFGTMVISEAIMGYNSGAGGMMCYCKHCCYQFVNVKSLEMPKAKCSVWRQMVLFMELTDIKFTTILGRKNEVHDHPPRPSDFPPPSMFFEEETISHLPYHLVFQKRGNPYDFAYGTLLTQCTSPVDKEILKLDEFLQYLREDSLLGGTTV
jgi:hypothetical protein